MMRMTERPIQKPPSGRERRSREHPVMHAATMRTMAASTIQRLVFLVTMA
jgi:hypothetical protein